MLADDVLVGSDVGRYRIARVLGRGGMGRVYLGVRADIGSKVAIKVLTEDCANDRTMVDRFFAEARAANMIRHDAIIDVLDLAWLPTGRPYIVMEYIDGRSLRDLLREPSPPPIGGVLLAMSEVLRALDAAHAAGIIHRDLKPDNVMLTRGGRTKVLDFGIAKLERNPTMRTATGLTLGTPSYMAPEQIERGSVDHRADIYAAGCVLFELLTGHPPFDEPSDFRVMQAHLESPAPRPSELRAEVPPALDDIVVTAMAKHPAERFASARAMARALEQLVATLPADHQRALSANAPQLPLPPASMEMPVVSATRATIGERPSSKKQPAPPAPPDGAARRRRVRVLAGGVAGMGIAAGLAVGMLIAKGHTDETKGTESGTTEPAQVVVAAHQAVGTATEVIAPVDAAPVAVAVPDARPIERAATTPPPKAGAKIARIGAPAPPGAATSTPTSPPASTDLIYPRYRSVPGVTLDDDPSTSPLGRARLKIPYPAGAASIDSLDFVPTALGYARKFEPDAALREMEFWVSDDGSLRRIAYQLYSAQAVASKDPRRFPCIVVGITASKELLVMGRAKCNAGGPTRLPSCSARRLAERYGAEVRGDGFSATWRDNEWFGLRVPDDC